MSHVSISHLLARTFTVSASAYSQPICCAGWSYLRFSRKKLNVAVVLTSRSQGKESTECPVKIGNA